MTSRRWMAYSSLACTFIGRQAAHLVQQQRAAVSLQEGAGYAPLPAEQLLLQQTRGHGGAVRLEEGPAPGLHLLDALGQLRPARAHLAGNENIAVHLAELIGPTPDGAHGGGVAVGQQRAFLLRQAALGGFPVFPLRRGNGGVALHNRGADVLNVAELDDDARDLLPVPNGQNGGQQGKSIDLIGNIREAGSLPVQHLPQVLLEQLALEKLLEVVTHHADLLVGALGNIAAAPQQAAQALFPGRVTLFFPKLHLPGPVVQNDRLTDGNKVGDGVYPLPHFHSDLLVTDVYGDGHALKGHIQMQPH